MDNLWFIFLIFLTRFLRTFGVHYEYMKFGVKFLIQNILVSLETLNMIPRTHFSMSNMDSLKIRIHTYMFFMRKCRKQYIYIHKCSDSSIPSSYYDCERCFQYRELEKFSLHPEDGYTVVERCAVQFTVG